MCISTRGMDNLTGQVRKSENYYFASGGLADGRKGEYTRRSTKATVVSVVQIPTSNSVTNIILLPKLAIRVIRSTWDESKYLERLKVVP